MREKKVNWNVFVSRTPLADHLDIFQLDTRHQFIERWFPELLGDSDREGSTFRRNPMGSLG